MKTLTNLSCVVLSIALFGFLLPVSANAKKDKPWEEFEKAEERYDDLSKKYKKMAKDADGEKAELLEKLSDNYDEMAEIKEDAAKDMEKGKGDKIDWSHYEKLHKENQQIEAKLGFKGPDSKKHKKPGKHLKDKEQRLKELEKLLDEKEKLIEEKKKLLEED